MREHAALLIVDMINALAFPGGAKLARPALQAAHSIARLKARLKRAGVPVVYVNDNYGQWRSDFRQIIAECGAPGSRGAPLVAALMPEPDDYFVLKPQQSGFHQSPLRQLLDDLGARRLVLTGIALDACVLATASDARMMGFDLVVPDDCVASETAQLKRSALRVLAGPLKAKLRDSRAINARTLGLP